MLKQEHVNQTPEHINLFIKLQSYKGNEKYDFWANDSYKPILFS